tara:strand:+ start:1009 stop:2304 length:1296 start_codon:yes stop_codon:yes gene_type:complete
MAVFEEFENFFKKHQIPFDSKFLIGVSGGLDSMVTLSLAIKCKLSIEVAHVNYQLRGKESETETTLVEDYCKKYGVVFHLKKVEINPDENIQIQARDIRYKYFNKIIKNQNLDYIITAHHANDNHETFLLNAFRGSGIKGLKGIPEKRGNIIRPILSLSKNQLLNYSSINKVPFNNDSSNQNIKYDRNFLRNEILNSLKDRFSSFENGLSSSINNLNKDFKLLNDLVDKMVTPCVVQKEESYFIYPTNNVPEHCWFHFLQKFGFNFSQINSWLEQDLQPGKYIESNSYKLISDRNCWVITPLNRNPINNSITKLELNKSIESPITLLCSSENAKSPILRDVNIGQFNIEKITFPLIIRKWGNGDKMKPIGMKGTKKISDILIDKKISILEKENIYVVISNNDIIWLIGHCISEKYKVENEKNLVLRLTYKP